MKRNDIQAAVEAAVDTLAPAVTVEHNRPFGLALENLFPFAGVYAASQVAEFQREPWNPMRAGTVRPASAQLTVPIRYAVAEAGNVREALEALWEQIRAAVLTHEPLWRLFDAGEGMIQFTTTSEVGSGEYATGQALARITFRYLETE